MDVLLNLTTSVLKTIGKLHSPWSHKKVNGEDYFSLLISVNRPCVLLSKTNGELTNLLIDGFWKHAAIYDGSKYVYEAIGVGVIKKDIITFLTSKDYVIALNPIWSFDPVKLIDFCISNLGKPYDYQLRLSDRDSFFCSELVFTALKEASPIFPLLSHCFLSVDSFKPQDFFSSNLLDPIWASKAAIEKFKLNSQS